MSQFVFYLQESGTLSHGNGSRRRQHAKPKNHHKPGAAARARARGTSGDSPVLTSAQITLSRWSPRDELKLPARTERARG